MKFIKRFWNDTGVKALFIAAPIWATIWSIAWSIQDNALNLWPFAYAGGAILFLFSMSWIFRNNP
jgi:hypothetical protein